MSRTCSCCRVPDEHLQDDRRGIAPSIPDGVHGHPTTAGQGSARAQFERLDVAADQADFLRPLEQSCAKGMGVAMRRPIALIRTRTDALKVIGP